MASSSSSLLLLLEVAVEIVAVAVAVAVVGTDTRGDPVGLLAFESYTIHGEAIMSTASIGQ